MREAFHAARLGYEKAGQAGGMGMQDAYQERGQLQYRADPGAAAGKAGGGGHGAAEYDPEEFREKVTEIRVPENGRLIFVFRDGHTVEKQHGFEWPDGRRCHICQQ